MDDLLSELLEEEEKIPVATLPPDTNPVRRIAKALQKAPALKFENKPGEQYAQQCLDAPDPAKNLTDDDLLLGRKRNNRTMILGNAVKVSPTLEALAIPGVERFLRLSQPFVGTANEKPTPDPQWTDYQEPSAATILAAQHLLKEIPQLNVYADKIHTVQDIHSIARLAIMFPKVDLGDVRGLTAEKTLERAVQIATATEFKGLYELKDAASPTIELVTAAIKELEMETDPAVVQAYVLTELIGAGPTIPASDVTASFEKEWSVIQELAPEFSKLASKVVSRVSGNVWHDATTNDRTQRLRARPGTDVYRKVGEDPLEVQEINGETWHVHTKDGTCIGHYNRKDIQTLHETNKIQVPKLQQKEAYDEFMRELPAKLRKPTIEIGNKVLVIDKPPYTGQQGNVMHVSQENRYTLDIGGKTYRGFERNEIALATPLTPDPIVEANVKTVQAEEERRHEAYFSQVQLLGQIRARLEPAYGQFTTRTATIAVEETAPQEARVEQKSTLELYTSRARAILDELINK